MNLDEIGMGRPCPKCAKSTENRLREQNAALKAEVERLRRQVEVYREDYNALAKKLVGETGASAMGYAEIWRAELLAAAQAFDSIRGAVETNQVVDKDVHGLAIARRNSCRSALGAALGETE